MTVADLLVHVSPDETDRLLFGEHHDPHSILGVHSGRSGQVVRAFHPDAETCDLLVPGQPDVEMTPLGNGLFGLRVPGSVPKEHSFRFRFADGQHWQVGDPYVFSPTLGETDLYLFGEGTHRRLDSALGARPMVVDGVAGTGFAVWAPNARRVSLIGDFCGWDGRLLPMRSLGASGVWELFVPGVGPGALYKFELKTQDGALRVKTDPVARAMELPPGTAAIVATSNFVWQDDSWMKKASAADIRRSPLHVYELHLGSWMRVPEEGNRSLSYREIAPRLCAHVKKLGFTHVEFMPLAEHAFYPSWGYQVTGYFAPTSRYGSPDDLRYLVDYLHQNDIGVIVDWVPAHFPKDDFSLRRFDGTVLYEHEDARRGEHPDWGTLIFNYGRAEVRAFLISNAVYWLKEFHIDGLRVDAVASMLYLDYSRKSDEWVPNQYGGRENIEAIHFLRQLNGAVHAECPWAFTIAEESTAWGGVTGSPEHGGLGFDFKWNMGWMHDTLGYFSKEPVHRKYHQDQLTFAMLYEYTETFINSISHDEVVHGKGALIEKMPGDFWQKVANLKLLYAYQVTRPGKQLMFMGGEFGQHTEWNVDGSIDWHLLGHPERRGLIEFVAELGRMYQATPELWRADSDSASFAWIDCSDRENSVMVFRRSIPGESGHVVVALNLTPVPRDGYRVGAPQAGRYVELLSSDRVEFGGSGYPTSRELHTDAIPAHGFDQSLVLSLPPLAALVLRPG
ncbi:MAG TPA: 1,4-alpha-glucan branching protein GlgB [Polyangiaceae bacterium]|nr:1,4-alpha-glucan branching protein GlgB [Polyangiaceae bacterium]